MNVSSFIANRIAFNQQRSFSRFIIRLSIVATTISVAVMLITLAFANGFQQKVSDKIFSFWGHIRIQEAQPYTSVIAEEWPITANDTVINLMRQNPHIQSIHPFATRYAILKTKEDLEGVLVKGLDSSYNFSHIKNFIKEGRAPLFPDSTYSREIMLSQQTASLMKLKVGDRVMIYFIRPDNTIRQDRLTITGLYKTGIDEYDRTFAIGDIRLIRRLNYWQEDQIGGYEIFLYDYKKIDTVTTQLYALPQKPAAWQVRSIKKVTPNIFDWLNMQDVTRNVLMGIMVVVAIINLITCLIILVLERIRMAGILKAMGATDWMVQKIFLRHSIIITLAGIVSGAFIGLGFLWLQVKTGFIKLQEEAYYLDRAAVQISGWEVAVICITTFFICLLVLTIPSYLVKKIQPVRAIHFR